MHLVILEEYSLELCSDLLALIVNIPDFVVAKSLYVVQLGLYLMHKWQNNIS